ncbi:LytTR family DNA-binding domain-containing protein [Lysobacter enzymogenes]|uniref:LytTR family DNA-binding domain-containing protein n=1 Tax=Lysobacter enzymogenes TaxID=69 RepID=UPI001A96B0C8|nr:LytTR family DNA-binding domain-containing protein [Lysobacter enzymogenes]QQP98430.1 LytTR family transcriptional regulator [Lysobacter enzymogenes]
MRKAWDKIRTRIQARLPAPRVRPILLGVAAWALVSLVSAAQGQAFAAYRGRPQDWWGTLGYTAAIFSVWAVLAPAIMAAAERLFASGLNKGLQSAIAVFGYLVASALHVALFVAVFWPVYGSGLANPLAMVGPVVLANFDKAAFAYAALIIAVLIRRHLRQRPDAVDVAEAAEAAPERPESEGLWIRVGAGSRLVRFQEIDWIAAAGDYAEVHAGGRSLLMDRSLAALTDELPAGFARIHRGAIVRLDRISEIRNLGRGDANVVLQGGHTLRLSRRYRDNLASFRAR